LLLLAGNLHPKPGSIGNNVSGKGEHCVNVVSFALCLLFRYFREKDSFVEFVVLPIVRRTINSFVENGVAEHDLACECKGRRRLFHRSSEGLLRGPAAELEGAGLSRSVRDAGAESLRGGHRVPGRDCVHQQRI